MVDEIIIVDTGSEDRTKEIVERYTDKIYDFSWRDDFAAARNYSFSLASGDFILWLDADDVILPKEREKFMERRKALDLSVSIVMMRYDAAFDEKFSYLTADLRPRPIVSQAQKKRFKSSFLVFHAHPAVSQILTSADLIFFPP